MPIKIETLDHLVLTVADIERSCEFYASILGMEIITFAGGRKALKFGKQKINLHQKPFSPQRTRRTQRWLLMS